MVVHAWSIRAPGEQEYDCDAIYEGYSNLFSIRLHHGGVFTHLPGRRYVNGLVSFVDFLDIDLMSVMELHEIVKSLGYVGGPSYYHFLDPTSELDYGLYAIGNDVDVHRLSTYVSVHKLINVYFEHGITYVDTYSRSPHASKVVIEEISDTVDPKDKKEKPKASKRLMWNGGSKYQVSGPWADQCVVDMSEKLCSCRKWELTGIPCKHAIASIWNMSLNNQDVPMPEYWVDKAYWLDTWKKVYSFKVGPVNGRSMWPKSECNTILTAPKHHKPIGRPRKKRRKGIDEEKKHEQRRKAI